MSERQNQPNSHVEDQIDAYALGILEDEAVAQVEAHLETCQHCQALLQQAREVTGLLYLAPRQARPPAGLKQRILARIAQEDRSGRARQQPLGRPAGQALGVPASASAEAPISAGDQQKSDAFDPTAATPLSGIPPERQGLIGTLRQILPGRKGTAGDAAQTSQAELPNQQQLQAIMRLLRSPHPAIWELPGTPEAPNARAHLLGSPEDDMAVLIVSGLEPLPPERDYQLWFLREGKPVGSAVFDVQANGEGQMLVRAPRQLGHYDLAAITPEPAGGSPGPTGPIIIAGQLTVA
jgi:anti-sigma-K factor RskA